MHNWRILNDVYIYDGTIEGLFTIVYLCQKSKTIPRDVRTENTFKVDLLTKTKTIVTNYEKSEIIFNKLIEISDYTMYAVFNAFLSGDETKEIVILKYLIYAFKYGYRINYMKDNEWVIAIDKIVKQVSMEVHRLTGFVRFREIAGGILYSDIEPDNNIVEKLARHFRARLPKEAWIINDRKRNIAAVYNKRHFEIVDSSALDFNKLINSDDEKDYQKMWKSFCKTIAIKERTNKRCQLNFMPRRYWKYMLEVSE